MSTRDIVPRTNNEGGIGTSIKRWLNGYFSNIFATGGTISGVNMISETGETVSGPVTTSAGVGDANKIPALDLYGKLSLSFLPDGISGEVDSIVTSSGAADAGKIPELNSEGLLDISFFPEGVGSTNSGTGFSPSNILASEDISAGSLVNIYNDSGAKCRKAMATSFEMEAHGYILTAVSSGQMAGVYFGGTNNRVTGLSIGKQYLSVDIPGICTTTVASGSGNIVQKVGFATSATSMDFKIYSSIRLA
jgi:hypothetical protein